MKITGLKRIVVDMPLEQPITTAIHNIRSIGGVLVFLETDAGVVGEGYAWKANRDGLQAVNETVASLADRVVGQDAHFVAGIWQAIWGDLEGKGDPEVTLAALAAIDTACWDIVGKAADLPLYKLFGACRDRVETYASGGLWLSRSIDELTAEADAFVQQGFRAMKVRVGGPDPARDAERVRAVRDAVGPDIGLMADANQAPTQDHAIELGRRLAPFDLVWFEEPVDTRNHAGHARVRAAVEMPIASGESEYTGYGMRAMIEADAADILMPDLQRMGGLTEFRRAAALAAAFDVPISTHIFTEQSLSIAGSAPNCVSVEHMPWFSHLFREDLAVEDGMLLIPDRPGTGFTFDPDAVAPYRLD